MMQEFQKGLHALLIGVSKYTHPEIEDLPAIFKDVLALAELLVDPNSCAYSPSHVTILTGQQTTAPNIRNAMQSFGRELNHESTLLLYFSGHGTRVRTGEGVQSYLCTRETDPDNFEETAISGDEFRHLLQQIPARRTLLLVDSCHSGGIGSSRSSQPAVQKGLTESYLRELTQGSGRVVINSSKEDQLSFNKVGDEHGLFTWYLMEGLKGKASSSDAFIRVLDLYSYVRQQVVQEQPRQTPILHAYDLDDNFPIAYIQSQTKETSALSPTAIYDLIIHDPVAGSKALSRYLSTVPEKKSQKIDVDLKRQELEDIMYEIELYGDRSLKGTHNRIVRFLLATCQQLITP